MMIIMCVVVLVTGDVVTNCNNMLLFVSLIIKQCKHFVCVMCGFIIISNIVCY